MKQKSRLTQHVTDPLLKKGQKKAASHAAKKANTVVPQSDRIFQLTILAVAPLLVYVLVLFMTIFWFFGSPVFVYGAASIIITVCLAYYLLVDAFIRQRTYKWKKWIGFLGAIAGVLGLSVGIIIHYEWMLFWRKYSKMMKYSNVAASQPALQFEDAGSLLFTEGSTLDKTRAVGYRDIRSSKTLCLAPVVDGQMSQDDPITYYAVGEDCCGWRASFTCDDAAKSARGGLLILHPSSLVSSSMEWIVDEVFDFKSFAKAVDLQKSVFATSTAENFRYIRWFKDPEQRIDAYRKRGLEAALLSVLAFIAGCCVMIGMDVYNEDRRQRKFATDMMQNDGA